MDPVSDRLVSEMASLAWQVRLNARVLGKTKVGCAALAESGRIWVGCNVEHKYRSHDVHAEVNAIGNMVAGGDLQLRAVLVAAERDLFTPCGSCLDWVFEFGGATCTVLVQSSVGGPVLSYKADELMPHYPR